MHGCIKRESVSWRCVRSFVRFVAGNWCLSGMGVHNAVQSILGDFPQGQYFRLAAATAKQDNEECVWHRGVG